MLQCSSTNQKERQQQSAAVIRRKTARMDEPAAHHTDGILHLPAKARFDYQLNRPEPAVQLHRRKSFQASPLAAQRKSENTKVSISQETGKIFAT